MTFCLDSIILKPENGLEIENAIILLHGYGGDGQDISMLSLSWKRHLPNTIFICPNGHEKCKINPSGYQWFDLSKDDPEYILNESRKAETKLNKFINEIKNEFNLQNNKICLSGFSQGCMMSLNLGLISDQRYSCIVGFSGKIINSCIVGFSGKIIRQEYLIKKKNVDADIMMIHGDADEIVSPHFLLEAKDFLIRNSINVETRLIKNCGHHIPVEASSIGLNYILEKFNNH